MALRYFQYRFPFVKPFRTGRQTFGVREGILLQLQRNGVTAYGEAAPLPGFSRESLDQVIRQLKEYSPKIDRYFHDEPAPGGLDKFYTDSDITPSLCFALDTLICDYLSQRAGSVMSHFLFENPQAQLPVNAVIPIQSIPETRKAVKSKIKEGYKTFKFKIGRNLAENLNVLEQIRDRFPEITIRIDANRSWNPEEALDNLAILERLDVEYCEEPLARPSVSALEQLTNRSPVPVALDETLADFNIYRSAAAFTPVLILKPMVAGSFANIYHINQLAGIYGNKIVFTTSLESGVGRMMTATLASGLGSGQSAHGLDTGGLLKTDVWHDRAYIDNGNIYLPDRPGPGKKYQFDPQNVAAELHLKRE